MTGLKKIICSGLLFGLVFFSLADAGQVSYIKLKDGSVLVGEVVSLKNGVYAIKTKRFGTLSVNQSEVTAINNKSSTSGSTDETAQPVLPDMSALMKALTGDRSVMKLIMALSQDPSVMEIARDPEILHLIRTGDIKALAENPKFKSLMNNPKIQEIVEKVK